LRGQNELFVAWTGLEKNEPIIKRLDGLAHSNPLWVRRWFKNILIEIIRRPNTRFEMIPIMLKNAFYELDVIGNDKLRIEKELKFTHRLKKFASEYVEHVRTGMIAKLLAKDKGEIIHWYETVKEIKINRNGKRRIVKDYSITPENVNIDLYKSFLMSKLKDTLNLAGFTHLC
jgi:hypothetical protein